MFYEPGVIITSLFTKYQHIQNGSYALYFLNGVSHLKHNRWPWKNDETFKIYNCFCVHQPL